MLHPFKSLLLLCLLLLTLTACRNGMLSVHTDYLSVEHLASWHVNTPDPLLNRPPFGQRLFVSWAIPRKYTDCPDLHLLITIRYKNREEQVKRVPLRENSGTYRYCLLEEEYCATGGFLTYKVQLIAGGCVLEEWRHQLWAELIKLAPEEELPEDVIDFNLEQ